MSKEELANLKKLFLLTGKPDSDFDKIVNFFKSYDSVYSALNKDLVKTFQHDYVSIISRYFDYYVDINSDLDTICNELKLFLDNYNFSLNSKIAKTLIDKIPSLNDLLEEYILLNEDKVIIGNDTLKLFVNAYASLYKNSSDIKNTTLLNFKEETLPMEETRELIRKAQNGDENARNRIIINNIGLVRKVAYWYSNRGIEVEDLINEGCFGIIKAIESFDLSRNVKFSTYALPKIQIEISRSIDEKSRAIRRPFGRKEILIKINKCVEKLTEINGITPNPTEIADYIGVSEKIVIDTMNDSKKVLSLEQTISTDEKEKTTIGDFVEQTTFDMPEDSFITEEMKDNVAYLLENSGLSEREINTIRMYFGFDGEQKTFREIGKLHGITHTAAQNNTNAALNKLRKNAHITDFAEYIGAKDVEIAKLKRVKK